MGSAEAWTVFANFCEVVMRRKEKAERECRRVRGGGARIVLPSPLRTPLQ